MAAVSLTMLGALIFYVPRAFELVSSAQLAAQNEKLTRQVEKSEERGRVKLGAVVDNIFDGVITIGEDGIIQSFNPACTLLFGYEPGEVIGQDVKMLMPHPHRATHDGYVRNYLDTGIARIIGGGGREVAGLRKDGSSFPLDLSITSFTVDGVRCFTGCLRDVTKQKSAMDERELLLSRLTNSNAELERFAYVASHDMQEPVRMMLSFSKLLEEDYAGVLDQEGQDYLKIIGSSALRMQNMIRDLMDYARLDGERREFAAIDLRQASTTVEENLRQLISESGALITYDSLPLVQGNAVQLMRLLQNLVINAIRYQPPRADTSHPSWYVPRRMAIGSFTCGTTALESSPPSSRRFSSPSGACTPGTRSKAAVSDCRSAARLSRVMAAASGPPPALGREQRYSSRCCSDTQGLSPASRQSRCDRTLSSVTAAMMTAPRISCCV